MGVSPSSLAKRNCPPREDIYTYNIVPELDGLSSENFGQPRIGKLARWDGQPSGKGMPDYPIEFSAPSHHTRGLLEVQLIDFGGS